MYALCNGIHIPISHPSSVKPIQHFISLIKRNGSIMKVKDCWQSLHFAMLFTRDASCIHGRTEYQTRIYGIHPTWQPNVYDSFDHGHAGMYVR